MKKRIIWKAILQLIPLVLLLILTFFVDTAFALLYIPVMIYEWLGKKSIKVFEIRKDNK